MQVIYTVLLKTANRPTFLTLPFRYTYSRMYVATNMYIYLYTRARRFRTTPYKIARTFHWTVDAVRLGEGGKRFRRKLSVFFFYKTFTTRAVVVVTRRQFAVGRVPGEADRRVLIDGAKKRRSVRDTAGPRKTCQI